MKLDDFSIANSGDAGVVLYHEGEETGILVQVGVSVFQKYYRIRGLSYWVSPSPQDGDQTFESDKGFQPGDLPSQGE